MSRAAVEHTEETEYEPFRRAAPPRVVSDGEGARGAGPTGEFRGKYRRDFGGRRIWVSGWLTIGGEEECVVGDDYVCDVTGNRYVLAMVCVSE